MDSLLVPSFVSDPDVGDEKNRTAKKNIIHLHLLGCLLHSKPLHQIGIAQSLVIYPDKKQIWYK